jgi:ParB family transcriptional regulator, chromosome partitioning protein
MSTNPRLGRGLAALMGDAPATVEQSAPQGTGVQAISIDALEPGPFQPRTSMAPGAMAELVESIKARGILQPLLARRHPKEPGRYQIIAGERRWRAAQSAGLHEVPALVRELSDQDAMAAALVENLQRQDLNPIEEAEGYKRLIEEFGLTQEQLGTAVGKSRSHIANCIRLLNLPAAVRTEVQAGTLSAGHARALLAHANPEEAARMVIAKGLNVRQTEALTTNRTEPAAPSDKPAPRDPETEALERDLSERLGLKVQIAFDGRGGIVRVHYRSLDQLDSLIALLSR